MSPATDRTRPWAGPCRSRPGSRRTGPGRPAGQVVTLAAAQAVAMQAAASPTLAALLRPPIRAAHAVVGLAGPLGRWLPPCPRGHQDLRPLPRASGRRAARPAPAPARFLTGAAEACPADRTSFRGQTPDDGCPSKRVRPADALKTTGSDSKVDCVGRYGRRRSCQPKGPTVAAQAVKHHGRVTLQCTGSAVLQAAGLGSRKCWPCPRPTRSSAGPGRAGRIISQISPNTATAPIRRVG